MIGQPQPYITERKKVYHIEFIIQMLFGHVVHFEPQCSTST